MADRKQGANPGPVGGNDGDSSLQKRSRVTRIPAKSLTHKGWRRIPGEMPTNQVVHSKVRDYHNKTFTNTAIHVTAMFHA